MPFKRSFVLLLATSAWLSVIAHETLLPHHVTASYTGHYSHRHHMSSRPFMHRPGNIALIIFLIILVAFNAFACFVDFLAPKQVKRIWTEHQEPEEVDNPVLTNTDEGQFEYMLIFRTGSPIEKFQIKHAWIDFEIIRANNELIGAPVRFSVAKLPDLICGEMRCKIDASYPLPPIVGIRASTNEKRGKICFFDYALVNMHDNSVIQERLIDDYISYKPKLFKGRVGRTGIMESLNQPLKSSKSVLVEYTRLEFIAISFSTALTACGLVLVSEYKHWYLGYHCEDGNIWHAIQEIVWVLPTILFFHWVLIKVCKHCKRQVPLVDANRGPAEVDSCEIAGYFFVGLLFVKSTAILVALFFFAGHLSTLRAIFWIQGTVYILTVVFGTWSLWEASIWAGDPVCVKEAIITKLAIKSAPTMNLSLRAAYAVVSGAGTNAKTIYCTPLNVSERSDAIPAVSSLSGKLYNPTVAMEQNKTGTTVTGKSSQAKLKTKTATKRGKRKSDSTTKDKRSSSRGKKTNHWTLETSKSKTKNIAKWSR